MERIIDSASVDLSGGYEKKIDHFNKQRKAMMSAPDFYRALDSILSSLREDFNSHIGGVGTSTRIFYYEQGLIFNSKGMAARMVHDFGSTIVKPTKFKVKVPIYGGSLEKALELEEFLPFFQILFNTEDNNNSLIRKLERLSQKDVRDIMIWTPLRRRVDDLSKKSVNFYYNGGGFHISCDQSPYYGCSRGVSLESIAEESRIFY